MLKSPAYPSLDSLVDLACRDGVDIRPTLLRVLTDLYVQKPAHTADEEIQYVELAQRLIETVDPVTRATVASRLAHYPAAPVVILHRLLESVPAPTTGIDVEPATEPAPDPDLVELFFAASSEDRRLILVNLDVAAQNSARRPLPATGELARRLENAALQRKTGEFSHALERALGIGRTLAERVVGDVSGEPFVVAAKALGLKADVFQRILLFLNPAVGQSVQRVYELSRLFDEITPLSAAHMLAIWRGQRGREPGRYEQAFWDDVRPNARTLTTPAGHRAARIGAPPSTRRASDRRA
jgi:uncharacterized protein (DUF2336 family)